MKTFRADSQHAIFTIQGLWYLVRPLLEKQPLPTAEQLTALARFVSGVCRYPHSTPGLWVSISIRERGYGSIIHSVTLSETEIKFDDTHVSYDPGAGSDWYTEDIFINRLGVEPGWGDIDNAAEWIAQLLYDARKSDWNWSYEDNSSPHCLDAADESGLE